jgi:hypothetical protein
MNPYSRAWLIWGAVTVLGFAGIEAKALAGPGENPRTLSAHLRLIFGFTNDTPTSGARRSLFYVLWGWFGLHILQRTTRDAFSD